MNAQWLTVREKPTPDVRCTNVEMVDTEREPTPDVRCTNVEMVDSEREPTPYVRCINVEQHTMDAKKINSRSDGQSKTKFISESR